MEKENLYICKTYRPPLKAENILRTVRIERKRDNTK